MLSLSQMTIRGYLGNGFILCRKCGENAHMPMGKGLTEYELEASFRSEGLYCDHCTAEIVEAPAEKKESDDEA